MLFKNLHPKPTTSYARKSEPTVVVYVPTRTQQDHINALCKQLAEVLVKEHLARLCEQLEAVTFGKR